MIFKEPLKNSFKGIGAVITGAGPAHAMYFASYELIKVKLSSESIGLKDSVAYMCAGGFGTCLHDSIMTPTDGKYFWLHFHI